MPEANKDDSFKERLNDSDWWTNSLMLFLKHTEKHIYDFRKAHLQEDKDEAIDYWVKYDSDGDWVPIQFKLRVKKGQSDIPVVLSQPFHGSDGKETIGRDIKGLRNGKTDWYYVAIKGRNGLYSEIYRIGTKTLLLLVEKLQEDWAETSNSFHKDKLNCEKMKRLLGNCGAKKIFGSEGEIWIQKNRNESFCKINSYIPEIHREQTVSIPMRTAHLLAEAFEEM